MPIVRAESTNNIVTIASGTAVHTISIVLFPFPCSGSRSPSRQRGKRSNAYTTMPTTTAKITTITAMTITARSKIARACGDCGLRALIASTLKSVALASRRFTNS